MFGDKILFRVHAIERMFKRGITDQQVRTALQTGTEIESYPNDFPYPSRLFFAWVGPAAVHVVAAYNRVDDVTIVITAYFPDPLKWSADFRTRRAP